MTVNTVHDFRRAVRHPYVWPGGYPTFFICDDGGSLCHACAKKERRNILESVAHHTRDGWRVIAYEINWEDGELVCVHCSGRIESAYGED